MLRIRKRLLKTDIFKLLELPEVVKVEISRKGNKSTLDKDFCYAKIYLFGANHLNEMGNAMIDLSKTAEMNQRRFLHTMGSQIKKDEFITMSNLTKLIESGVCLENIKVPIEYIELLRIDPDDLYLYLKTIK